MSSFMMYVAVVGGVLPACANAAAGVRTDAITRTFTTVFFIASLPDVLTLLRRCRPASRRQGPFGSSREAIASAPPDPEVARDRAAVGGVLVCASHLPRPREGRAVALPSCRMRGERRLMFILEQRRERARRIASVRAKGGHCGDHVVVRGGIAPTPPFACGGGMGWGRIADQHAEIVTACGGLGDRQRDVELQRRCTERAERAVIDGLVLEEGIGGGGRKIRDVVGAVDLHIQRHAGEAGAGRGAAVEPDDEVVQR